MTSLAEQLPFEQTSKVCQVTNPHKLGLYGGEKMLIEAPSDYERLIGQIPFGKTRTLPDIRAELAAAYGADFTCPMTANKYVNALANLAEETQTDLTYWRVLRADGELNERFPGGIEAQKAKLQAEGLKIVNRGRTKLRYFVVLD